PGPGTTAGEQGGTVPDPPAVDLARNARRSANHASFRHGLTPRPLRLTGSSPRALRGQEGRKWNGPPAGTRTWRRRRDHDGAPIGTRRAAPRDATAPTAPRDAPHALPAGARRPRPPRARGA